MRVLNCSRQAGYSLSWIFTCYTKLYSMQITYILFSPSLEVDDKKMFLFYSLGSQISCPRTAGTLSKTWVLFQVQTLKNSWVQEWENGGGWAGVHGLQAGPRPFSPPPAARAESLGSRPRGRGGSRGCWPLRLGWFRVEKLSWDQSSGRGAGGGKNPRWVGSWGRDRADERARTPPFLCQAQPRCGSRLASPSPRIPYPQLLPLPHRTHPGISAPPPPPRPPPPSRIPFSQHPFLQTAPPPRTFLPGVPSLTPTAPSLQLTHCLETTFLNCISGSLYSAPLPRTTCLLGRGARSFPSRPAPRTCPSALPPTTPRSLSSPPASQPPSPPPLAPWRAASRTSCSAPSA